jgi:CubicO group peptidase (beta-lactamase class C family)
MPFFKPDPKGGLKSRHNYMHSRIFLATMLSLLIVGRIEARSPVAAKLQPLVDRKIIAGAVTLIGTKDEVLSVEMIGAADLSAGRPMTADTVFWIASMTKSVTGTALMMLVDEGKVNVDDPVEKYLPEFKGQMLLAEHDDTHAVLRKPAHPLTIRTLLTHTGGLTPHTTLEPRLDLLPLRENVLVYPLLPLRFEPGSRYEYSNAGINTVGRIVEVVSGQSFDEFLEQRLFAPLGMKDTTFWPNADQLRRLAKIYRPKADLTGLEEIANEQLTAPFSNRARGVNPAGGLFSTAHDLYLLGRMILNGGSYGGRRYLSTASVAQMTSNQVGELPIGPDHNYGYGFGWIIHRVHPAGDPTGPGTFGAGGAYNTQMGIDPAHNLVSVLMVQQSGFPESVRQEVRTTFTQAAEDAVGR